MKIKEKGISGKGVETSSMACSGVFTGGLGGFA